MPGDGAEHEGAVAGAADYILAPIGLDEGIRHLASDPIFASILALAGAPRFRRRANGFQTLLHIILEQQVSIDAAAAMFRRLSEHCVPLDPAALLGLSDETMRQCGFSRQKTGYARHLAEQVASGALDFAELAYQEDAEARASLTRLKGIGDWSAEIYLVFALGRTDIWPAADLGLLLALQAHLGLAERPDFKQSREIAGRWAPWRSVAACLFWQSYLHARKRQAPILPAQLYATTEAEA